MPKKFFGFRGQPLEINWVAAAAAAAAATAEKKEQRQAAAFAGRKLRESFSAGAAAPEQRFAAAGAQE
jgi:hypothetical protein